MELKINQERWENKNLWGETGIFIRALDPNGKWQSVDIVFLEKDSLLAFLRSRGGDNKWAEDVCGILMGHGHLHTYEPPTAA